ncbi:MAG: universal stress protein [Deltaproteobacteria bacterium]|nr:universal stress protein [Deltaproteobacteria bacterium]
MSTGPFRPRRLLVPYDFGPGGDRALRIARMMGAGSLHVLHVLPPPGFGWTRDDESRRRDALDALRSALSGTGVEGATRHVLIGGVADRVSELAGKLECDLVLVAARVGSRAAAEIVAAAPCSVLVVR